MPDTYYVYGDKLKALDLYDNRTITYDMRFMLTNNVIDPKVYQVTKILDLYPSGLLKLSLKQDEFNHERDNVSLKICNFYSDSKETKVDENKDLSNMQSTIVSLEVDANGELEEKSFVSTTLSLGTISYFKVKFPVQIDVDPEWHIEINQSDISKDEKEYYEGLIKMDYIDDGIISMKPAKANSLIGKHFILSVSDPIGSYSSSVNLAVIK